ncbi:DNA ligase [Oceanospirillum linum]|uniref:DNA ligase n=1 Tax=Oceanospirillum linum TaxID=966 RepID=A0A1T1HGM3_OCELI|nr:DNA ligase [Oceanospirillum linum]
MFAPSSLWGGTLPPPSDNSPLPLMLAKHYQQQDNIRDYWVSEKLDGVRAFWDGSQLKTRQGNPIHAPQSMLNALPRTPLDGELWLGRGRFAEVSGLVRQHEPVAADWADIQYRIFDLPDQLTPFDQRVRAIEELCQQLNLPWLQPVHQFRLPDREALNQYLEQLTEEGAEGLMLHRGSALYQVGRSDDLMKVKLYEDAEAVVLGYTEGKGQFTGMMGALRVRLADGREIKIGSGFSHAERRTPPSIGSVITYRYNGQTSTGLPRFARFMRIRDDYEARDLK